MFRLFYTKNNPTQQDRVKNSGSIKKKGRACSAVTAEAIIMTETTRMTGFSEFSAEVLVSSEERQCCIRKRALCALCDENWVSLSGGHV